MPHFFYLLGLVGAVLATSEVTVTWVHDKGSGVSASFAVLAGETKQLALSCSSILKGQSSIDFSALDEDGNGNFKVGDKAYLVHSSPELSGGPTCVTIYDDAISMSQCKGVDWDADLPTSTDEKVLDCFDNEHVKLKLGHLLVMLSDHKSERAEKVPGMVGHINNSTSSALMSLGKDSKKDGKLEERQFCHEYRTTELVGDGFPHQNWFHTQITENNRCAEAPCTVGVSNTITIGWSASTTIFSWIGANFAVSRSVGSSQTYGCGGRPFDTVCSYYNAAHTAYTVHDVGYWSCGGHRMNVGPDVVLSSPNNHNKGGGYYCVTGACNYNGYNWWDRSAHQPGGP